MALLQLGRVSVIAAAAFGATGAWGQSADIAMDDQGVVTLSGLLRPGADQAPSPACADQQAAAAVVCEAEAFLATLTDDQKAQVLLPMTVENATAWSNLPCGAQCRVGIALADLDEAQKSAALRVILAASGTGTTDGFFETTAVMMGDSVLTLAQEAGLASAPTGPGGTPPDGMAPPDGMTPPDGMAPPDGMPPPDGAGGGLVYSADNYFIAFFGTPSVDQTWQLQFGGHHLATLHTYVSGTETSATPYFVGVEPKVWSVDGTVYSPLTDDRDAMVAMLGSLTADQLASAKLDQVFSDVLLGPGQDGQFPDAAVGLSVADLTQEQKDLVLVAMSKWVADTNDQSAAAIMQGYAAQLDQTYIAFSGDASLTHHADYVRIDGPGVWIEFVCQNGVVFGDQIHYHTIWRDQVSDYGAVYDF